MNYLEVEIGKNTWLIPDFISNYKTNTPMDVVPSFEVARRKPPIKDHSEKYFIDLNVKKEMFKDKIVVDMCSGAEVLLDEIAEVAKKVIRVDTEYDNNSKIERILSNSKFPNKYEFNSSSAFSTNLPDNTADIVIEDWGLFYYFKSIIFPKPFDTETSRGIENIFFDEIYNGTVVDTRQDRIKQGIHSFLKSVDEKIRITKNNGTIIMGPHIDYPAIRLYNEILKPSLDNFVNQGLIKLDDKLVPSIIGYSPYDKIIENIKITKN